MNDLKMHHICIQTNDYELSKEFYTNVLDFEIVKETKNFHGRDFNTWLKLNDFYIELQTGKSKLKKFEKETESLVHFALETRNIKKTLKTILDKNYNHFVKKEEQILYTVENGQLFKIIAPEGTIVEIREIGEV